jgi:hypothetical protein
VEGSERYYVCNVCAKGERLGELRKHAFVFGGAILGLVLLGAIVASLGTTEGVGPTCLGLVGLFALVAAGVSFWETGKVAINALRKRDEALDPFRDTIAIALRKPHLGEEYVYWTRAEYAKLRPGMF